MDNKAIYLLVIFLFTALPLLTFALETTWPPSPFGTNLTDDSTLTDLVRYFYEWGIFIGGIAVLISLLIGGFLYLTSMGNPARMSEAKDRIFSALTGLVLLFSIYLILNIINPELTVLTVPTIAPPSAALKAICEASLYDPTGEHIIDLKPGEIWNGDGTIIRKIEIETTSGMECELILCTDLNLGGTCNSFDSSVDDTGTDYLSAENKAIKFEVGKCERAILYDDVEFSGNSTEITPGSGCKDLEAALEKVVKSVDVKGSCQLYMYKEEDTSCSTDPLFIIGSDIENLESSYGITKFGSAKIP